MTDFTRQGNYKDFFNLGRRKQFQATYARPEIDLNREVQTFLDLKDYERILDMGCGNGDLLLYLREHGHKGDFVGVDLSHGMIRAAMRSAQARGLDFGVGNAERLAFRDQTFDRVIAKHMLYHVNDLGKVVEEAYRVLKNDGFFLVVLNSLAGGSREKLRGLRKGVSEVLRYPEVDTWERINFENYQSWMRGFRVLRELRLTQYLIIEEKEAVLDYIDSFRDFWEPVPTDTQWAQAMEETAKTVENIITEQGSFKDIVSKGLILLEKV